MKSDNSVHALGTNYPTHCAGRLHKLEWVVDGSIAICVGGHDGVVWVVGEHGRLRCEINATIRLLAEMVINLRQNVRVETKTIYVEIPAPDHLVHKRQRVVPTGSRQATKEELVELTSRYKQRDVAEKIGISRGLLSDIISGRRSLTLSVALKAGQAIQDWTPANAAY